MSTIPRKKPPFDKLLDEMSGNIMTLKTKQQVFAQQETIPNLSMYSIWTTSPLTAKDVMTTAAPPVVLSIYDSRCNQRTDSMLVTSASKANLNSTHSSYWRFRRSDEEKVKLTDAIARLREEVGESAEQPAHVVSDSDDDAGPPKRVRTHTDLRLPYSCRHCALAFKTKGNLTKHMKSKAHHKKCVELGIVLVPVAIDESQIDTDSLAKQEMEISCTNWPEDEDKGDGEWDDDEEEEDDEGVPTPSMALQ